MRFDWLDDLIGKPYRRGGRGPDAYDCFGLLIEVCRRSNITLPNEPTGPTPEDNHRAFLQGVDLFRKLPQPQDKCMVLLSVDSKLCNHCGFVVQYPYFIHVLEKKCVVIERLDSLFWKSRVRGYYL